MISDFGVGIEGANYDTGTDPPPIPLDVTTNSEELVCHRNRYSQVASSMSLICVMVKRDLDLPAFSDI